MPFDEEALKKYIADDKRTDYIPMAECKKGHLYRIHSRNLGLGIYNGDEGFIGIRTKFESRYLFTEYHWDQGPPFGTVKPFEDLGPIPAEIPVMESMVHEHGSSWAVRDGVEIPVIRNWEKDKPIGEPHGKRQGFEDRWADTGERLPDNQYPHGKENEAMFKFLDEYK